MNLEIKSTALSMASAIASSPTWDVITVEATSMYMLHNPYSFAAGDFETMLGVANFLQSARDMFAKIYSARSKKSISKMIEKMSAETWFFGQEIIDAGFADRMLETVSSGEPQDKVLVMAGMKAKFAEMKKRQNSETIENEGFDVERAAAAWRNPGEKKPVLTDSQKNTGIVDKASLMKNKPELYKTAVADGIKDGIADGIAKERKRIKNLIAMKAHPEYEGLPQVSQAIDFAVANGLSEKETINKIMETILYIYRDPTKKMASMQESPGDIGVGKDKPIVLSAGGNQSTSSLLHAALRQESAKDRITEV